MPGARLAGAAAAIAAVSAVGCINLSKDAANAWLDRRMPFSGPGPTADKVFLQTTLIEQPAGDPYLTRELWAAAGKLLPPARAALLAENGLRVGRIDGNPPPEFLKLVTSEHHTIRPTQSTCTPGEPKIIPVNGPLGRVEFAVAADIGAKPTGFDLQAAECGLAVTPTAADGGQVKLVFEPRVQHGQKQGWLRPTADGTGFAWRDGKPGESFSKLAWEVTLGPKDYLVIGPTESPVGKLGGAVFVNAESGAARMRVLVVRAWRGPSAADLPVPGQKAVAARAATPVARGRP